MKDGFLRKMMYGVYDKKTLIHAKRWDVYVNEKEKLIKGGYLM